MSRVFVTAAIVLLVCALLLSCYELLSFRFGLPSIVSTLTSLWPDIGATLSDNKVWVIVVVSGLVVAFLLIRFPKFGKY
jgi:hypothetical protein